MKYVVKEEKLKSIFKKYMDDIDWEVDSNGDDITVWGDKNRVFDTFGEYITTNPMFLDKMYSLFGEKVDTYILDWFNDNFEWDSHPGKVVDYADFYDDIDED